MCPKWGYLIANWHKITNIQPNYQVKRLLFVCGEMSTGSLSRNISKWPQHFRTLNCPSLRSGQLRGQKCLPTSKSPSKKNHKKLFPQKKNNIPHFLIWPYINSLKTFLKINLCYVKIVMRYVTCTVSILLYAAWLVLL